MKSKIRDGGQQTDIKCKYIKINLAIKEILHRYLCAFKRLNIA